MAFENLLVRNENGILILTVNRPEKMNALNDKTVQEIGKAMAEAVADPLVKGIIITGAGDKAFVAGADIAEMEGFTLEQGKAMTRAGQQIFRSIEESPKPVIAAVNGYALGGGCELAMACHIRVASQNARFGQPEVNLGLIACYGGTQRLTQLIGKAKSLELQLTGMHITAAQAMDLGLVNYVTSESELLPTCRGLLEKITSKAPAAIAGVIASINAFYETGVDGYETEGEQFGKCFSTSDFKEGASAFLEKRKANFAGK
jgi:enoyl-CoA hydratase